jgi:hypothetical protein
VPGLLFRAKGQRRALIKKEGIPSEPAQPEETPPYGKGVSYLLRTPPPLECEPELPRETELEARDTLVLPEDETRPDETLPDEELPERTDEPELLPYDDPPVIRPR